MISLHLNRAAFKPAAARRQVTTLASRKNEDWRTKSVLAGQAIIVGAACVALNFVCLPHAEASDFNEKIAAQKLAVEQQASQLDYLLEQQKTKSKAVTQAKIAVRVSCNLRSFRASTTVQI